MDFLNYTILGNPIYLYIVSVLVIFLSIIAGIFIKRLGRGKLKEMAEKTKTKLDDVVVSLFETPLNLFFTTIGIYIGVSILNMPQGIKQLLTKALFVILTLLVVFSISKLIDRFFELIVLPRIARTESKIDDQVAILIKKSLKVLLWVFTILIVISNLGYDVLSLLTGLGLGGLAVAMAAKDTLANIFGGITIFLDRPFKIGDLIRVEGHIGNVVDIGLRTTRIRTFEGHLISVPNSQAASSVVENISARPDLRVRFTMGVKYGTPVEKLLKVDPIVKEVASSIEGISKEKEATAYFIEFGDSSLNFQITYYITDIDNQFMIKHKFNTSLLKKFEENGIEIPFTTYTIIQEK